MMELNAGLFVLYLVLALLAGGVIGFFVARYVFKRQIQKNPPINEKMIRAMFESMGRKPSEKQVREVMRNINSQNK